MDEKTFYTKILKIKLPWYVKQVIVDEAEQRIDIYIETNGVASLLLAFYPPTLFSKWSGARPMVEGPGGSGLFLQLSLTPARENKGDRLVFE